MGEEGAEADKQMNRRERCGSDGMKISGSPVLSRAFGHYTLPSLPPRTPTPTATPGQAKAHVVHFRGQAGWLCL